MLEHLPKEEYEEDLNTAIQLGRDTYALVVHILNNTESHDCEEPRPTLLQLIPALNTAQENLYTMNYIANVVHGKAG